MIFLPMCGASLSSFIIHMVIVPFLNQLVNQMEKFIFCSAGNISTSGTKYRTIGYKLSVKNTSGNVIQTVYYQMPGKYMKLKYQKRSNGKEYLMYSISLNVMRKRLSTQTLNALSSGSCTIILDACMVLRVNGKNKGGMNDNGPPGERFILHMQVYPKRQTGRTAHSQHCIRIMARR